MEKKLEEQSLEQFYGIVSKQLPLKRVITPLTKKLLDVFDAPGSDIVITKFPEFTCLCPKTNQPDFGKVTISYIPGKVCVELKSLKYYLNSFRNEGHFHEEVCNIIQRDLRGALAPDWLVVQIKFNFRGGLYTTVFSGDIDEDRSFFNS